jgi:5-formyltetrahydrofolate cyclo-ligase
MGRGFGFFDRFLAHRAALAIKIGIAFRFQIVESLPLESHDVKLDLVVTD